MRGFKSRKFLQAAAAEAALIAALVACFNRADLAPYIPYVIGGLVAVAGAYGAANAWQARGGPPFPADM